MPLTAIEVKGAKPSEKLRKLSDEKGLQLWVFPDGAKRWRLAYRFAGKQRALALGVYPEVSLADARTARDEARTQLRQGTDPGYARKVRKLAGRQAATETFEALAKEWANKHLTDKADTYRERVEGVLDRFLYPHIGTVPVREIDPPTALAVLRRVEQRSVDTCYRARSVLGMVMRYAVATGRADRDPTPDLKGALATRRQTHYPAVTKPDQLGRLLIAIDGYQGTPAVCAAMKLTPMLFVRPGELRHMEWDHVDLDAARWEIPTERMKMRQSHVVPLATQAVTILRELHRHTGRGRYVFPSGRGGSRPLSENGVRTALQTLEHGKLTPHGFRATARTLLDEQLRERIDLVEHQLAHQVRDALGRAYNRTTHIEERTAMMQRWADYLDRLKATAMTDNVVPLQRSPVGAA